MATAIARLNAFACLLIDMVSIFICQWTKVYYLWRPNLRDEANNHLIELAVAGGAHYVASHNLRDLRSGELAFGALQTVTPQQLIESEPIA